MNLGFTKLSFFLFPTWAVGSALALTSLLGVVLGVLASLLVMAAVVVALVSRARNHRKPEVKMVYHKGAAGHHLPDDVDDTNPDVIPVNDGEFRFFFSELRVYC